MESLYSKKEDPNTSFGIELMESELILMFLNIVLDDLEVLK